MIKNSDLQKRFSTSFLHQNYIILGKVISQLYHWRQDKFCLWGFAISFLYQKREMLYLLYICFGEGHIFGISCWKMKMADRRKIWNSYIRVPYLDISLLQKALSQCYTLFDTSEKRYRTVLSQSYIRVYHFRGKLYHSAIPCFILPQTDTTPDWFFFDGILL